MVQIFFFQKANNMVQLPIQNVKKYVYLYGLKIKKLCIFGHLSFVDTLYEHDEALVEYLTSIYASCI